MFENEEFSLNRFKSAFVFSYCSWARVALNSKSFVAKQLALLARL